MSQRILKFAIKLQLRRPNLKNLNRAVLNRQKTVPIERQLKSHGGTNRVSAASQIWDAA